MNRYRVLLPLLVNGEHGQGDEFDHEFDSPEDEAWSLDNGLLEIVPRRYRVIGDSRVHEVRKDDEDPTFEAALRMFEESHLVDAGHIVRDDPPPKKPRARKKKED